MWMLIGLILISIIVPLAVFGYRYPMGSVTAVPVYECGMLAEPVTKQLCFFDNRTFLVVAMGMLFQMYSWLFVLLGTNGSVGWLFGLFYSLSSLILIFLYYVRIIAYGPSITS